MPREMARRREADERRRDDAAAGQRREAPGVTAMLALQRGAGNAATAKLMRLTKPQQKQLDEWQVKLQNAAERLDSKKPATVFTDAFKHHHVRSEKTDDIPKDFAQRSGKTATERFEGRAEQQRREGADAEERAGVSSLVLFGPTAMQSIVTDMKAWASGRAGIYAALKTAVQANGAQNVGVWQNIGGRGGARCLETTANTYHVLTTSVHARLDRQGGVVNARLRLGPSVVMSDDGKKLEFRIHHFDGTE